MRNIGSKYRVTGDIIRKADNSPLPPDEPLILFRGRDKLTTRVLDFYLGLRTGLAPTANLTDLQAEIGKVKQWQKDNPDKLTTPTDRHTAI